MNSYLERLQQEHRRLNRRIDNCRNAVRQNEMKALKRLRLKLKDKIAQFQRTASPITP
ncbi:YdcH family protein [Sphingorhabdus sp.]|uniref:YdcH family protein n=1 Tax=Sphingorhabdus sp. TaxID=1902408 RepID=UPI0035AE89D4